MKRVLTPLLVVALVLALAAPAGAKPMEDKSMGTFMYDYVDAVSGPGTYVISFAARGTPDHGSGYTRWDVLGGDGRSAVVLWNVTAYQQMSTTSAAFLAVCTFAEGPIDMLGTVLAVGTSEMAFAVEDNGQGVKEAKDRFLFVYGPPPVTFSTLLCLLPYMSAIDGGNIKVKPGSPEL